MQDQVMITFTEGRICLQPLRSVICIQQQQQYSARTHYLWKSMKPIRLYFCQYVCQNNQLESLAR